MDRDTVWKHIHSERAALARTLAALTPAQWEQESQCAGWTVKDVAAHVISNPQLGMGTVATFFVRNLGRGYNTMVFRETRRLSAAQSPEQILADFEKYADSRK